MRAAHSRPSSDTDRCVLSVAGRWPSGASAGRGAQLVGLVRWGALTDMLGFNLLPVPMTRYLGHRYDAGRDALMAVASAAGLLYAAIGSIGAVIVATVVPPLLATATPHAVAELELVRRIVFVGLWQTLGTIPGACGCWSSACASIAHHHGWAASASPRWLKRQHEMANGSP